VKDNLVKSTRYNKVHAGGYSPRDYLTINKNPGPGDYENPTSIADITQKRSGRLSSNFASKTGSSWLSKSQFNSGLVSPRDCAFSTPNSGEPFSHFGSFKGYSRPTEKHIGDFWTMNTSTLKSKRNTINQIDQRISESHLE
jgi:hypothetical protein